MFKKLYFKLIKLFMRTIGQSSDGIRLCFQHGLTSGKMLDYIYQNKPSGRWLIGNYLDRKFLNDPGWDAVRIRRKHLEQLLIEAITELRRNKQFVSILDVASGPAAYILSVLQQIDDKQVMARCRDFEKKWVEDGKTKAQLMGLSNVIFEQGDAFNREQILALTPQANIAISSGFYDWFNDDNKVKESIKIIYDTLQNSGYFIVTNQCAHPKLELTEHVFLDFNKEPLKMTMRPKETINQWLTEAGFSIVKTLSDEQGYYSVTKVLKPEH